MLPDFPLVKKQGSEFFFKLVHQAIEADEPLLRGIHHIAVHEGSGTALKRGDSSEDASDFLKNSAELLIDKKDMKGLSPEALVSYARRMGEQFAAAQAKHMFTKLAEVTDKVGNVTSASELGLKEAFLESQRTLHVDFDPVTLEPKGLTLVLHPSQVDKVMAAAKEWESDQAFKDEMTRIREAQLEAWRDRENRRKLVD